MITLVSGHAASGYAREILHHAGLTVRETTVDALSERDRLIVISGIEPLATSDRERLEVLVRAGAGLVVCGGTAGLDDLVGARASAAGEGYIVDPDPLHPVTSGLASPLHVFAGSALAATSGASLAGLMAPDNATRLGDAVVVNRPGAGATVAIGPDIGASVLHIQIGREIHEDGVPAGDGTAPIDDGILKTDDGIVLSWQYDRIQTPPPGVVPDCPGIDPAYPAGDTPWFGVPIADELRTLLLQAVAWVATGVAQPLVAIAEWPDRLDAVGLVSHDSDGNLDAGAQTTLHLLDQAGIASTWCQIWGPNYEHHYDPATFRAIADAGHEIALHYNAVTHDGGTWGRDHLARQAAYVRNETGVERFASNKNHYLRWEGATEFFGWLEDEGIAADQCKGPSKKGNTGYPHGSTLPWFPLDAASGRWFDVLEIPLQFQDLWLTTTAHNSATTIAAARRHHGVAHFLFHQVHLHTRPEVARAMLEVIEAGRSEGLEWWTSARINDWERARRQVAIRIDGSTIVIESAIDLPAATIAIAWPSDGLDTVQVTTSSGQLLDVRPAQRWNQPTLTVTLDLPAGETVLQVRDAR